MATEQAPSMGKTTSIASLGTGSGITVLLWFAHKAGIDDMPPEVAAAIIGFAGAVAGSIMHYNQRKSENAQANGTGNGPAA